MRSVDGLGSPLSLSPQRETTCSCYLRLSTTIHDGIRASNLPPITSVLFH
jgi:hypothetical protein